MEYYAAIKKNEFMSFAGTCSNKHAKCSFIIGYPPKNPVSFILFVPHFRDGEIRCKTLTDQVQCLTPVIPEVLEAKAGGSLEARSSRPA